MEKKYTSFYLDQQSINAGKTMAGAQGISLSALVRNMLMERFKVFQDEQRKLYSEMK